MEIVFTLEFVQKYLLNWRLDDNIAILKAKMDTVLILDTR